MYRTMPQNAADTSGGRDKTRRVQGAQTTQTGNTHGHLGDLGFGSLVAYFLCLLSSVSVRSGGAGSDLFGEGFLVAFLAFMGAVCLALLFLAMAESYLLRHGNHRRLAFASGVLMALGPVFCVVESATGASNSFLMVLLFALSGCGYALCLLTWGRILSLKKADSSSRQVLADACAAVIVMVAVSVAPETVSASAMALLGFTAGAIGSRKAVPADVGRSCETQVVVSDTRDAIPRSSYFAGGMPWAIYGMFLALLSDVHVFGGFMNIAMIAVVALAGVAGIALVRVHRSSAITLSKTAWASIPLLIMALIIFVAGEEPLLKAAVVLVVVSVIISYVHLMAHFAALAHRPNLLSDQLFAWGWLAPSVGMFAGVFVGIACRLIDDPVIKLFLSVMGGILVAALIVSMRSVETIAIRNREQEIDRQVDLDASAQYESQMNEVFLGLGLSVREGEVAMLLLQGHSQAAIGDQLYVAASTVNTHVKHIYRKAGVRSKQEFIDLCQARLKERLVGTEEGV